LRGDTINICEKKKVPYEHVSNSVRISRKNVKKRGVLNALYEVLDDDSLDLETRSIVQRQLLN
jgi:ribosomal protein L7Ae-like RNA K-turn-binding protein